MPSSLFDYIEGSFHTMGYRPAPGTPTSPGPNPLTPCPGVYRPCTQFPNDPCCTGPGASSPLCNPASVGKRFSFTFKSGKKWTFSNKVDAEARAFYCNPASIAEPEEEPTEPPLGERFVGCLPWDQVVEIRRRITREQKGDGCYADINFSLPECVRARAEDKRIHEMSRDLMIRAGQCPSFLGKVWKGRMGEMPPDPAPAGMRWTRIAPPLGQESTERDPNGNMVFLNFWRLEPAV